MSYGAGDIIKGFELARDIYKYGFREENAADARYKQFQEDISEFRNLLESLNAALKDAHQRYENGSFRFGASRYDPLPNSNAKSTQISKDIDAERRNIIGNFQDTLSECDRFLKENNDLLNPSNLFQNLKWNTFQQVTVEDLRARLRFHSMKIRFVIDHLTVTFFKEQGAKLDDLLGMTEEILRLALDSSRRGSLNQQEIEANFLIGEEVEQRFKKSLWEYLVQSQVLSSVEEAVDDIPDLPLKQGFDALLHSAEESLKCSEPTPGRYLHLLRARWLLNYVQSSKEYASARPGAYYKRATNQLAQAIWEKFRRNEWNVIPPESHLLELSEAHFRMSPLPLPLIQNDILEEPLQQARRPTEGEPLQIKLASDGSRGVRMVTVFCSSRTRFRIILDAPLLTHPKVRTVTPLIVLTNEDKLIPCFALATAATSSLELSIVSRDEKVQYEFESTNDLQRFQTVLTGYNVSHDEAKITAEFPEDGIPTIEGRVQLWQPPGSESGIDVPGDGTEPTTTAAASSSSSNTSHSRRESALKTIRLRRSSNIKETPKGFEAEQLKSPQLLIIGKCTDEKSKRFAIVSVEIDGELQVSVNRCKGCIENPAGCLSLAIDRKRITKKQKLEARVLYSAKDSTGKQQDANSLDLLRFRTPRHPKYTELQKITADFFWLHFQNVEARNAFSRKFELQVQTGEEDRLKHDHFRRTMKHFGDQPAAG